MKRLLMLVSAGLGVMYSALAADFPDADGKGDLASADSWNGPVPASTETVKITASGTYTASSDVTFAGLTAGVPYDGTAVFDLTQQANRKITLQGTAWDKFNIPNNMATIEFKGGLWDFCSGGTFYAGSTSSARAQCHTVRISSGCVVTNVQDLYVAQYDWSNRVEIVDGSTLHVVRNVNLMTPTTLTCGNGFLVTNRSTFVVEGNFKTDTGANATAGDSFVTVLGKGSRFIAMGYCYLGAACSGNVLTVADGACANFTGAAFYLGQTDTSANNRTVVSNGGTLAFGKSTIFYMGNAAGSNGNRLDILSGSQASFNKESYMGYKGNANVVTVSNATLSCWNLVWGNDAGCSGNALVVCGTNPVVKATGELIFKNSSRLTLTLPDVPYAEECVPVAADTLTLDETCSLTVQNLDGYVEKSMGKRKVLVVRTKNGVIIPDEVLASANAALASEGASFFLPEDSKELWLYAPVRKGLMLIFR